MTEQLTDYDSPWKEVIEIYPENRLQWKLSLVRRLYEWGYSREDIRELFRFIDWIMVLLKELALSF